MKRGYRFSQLFIGTVLCGVLSAADAAEDGGIAEVARVDGKALVDRGAGYVPAKLKMRLKDGFRVIALEGSIAVVQYDDGCRYEVEDTEVHRVDFENPCKAVWRGTDPVAVGAASVAAVTALAVIVSDGDGGGGGGNVIQSRPLSRE